MFGKIKKVIADLEALFLLIQAHADDIEQLKADIAVLKPKKKVVTKPTAKVLPKKK
jgi:hypothetical protein